MRYTYRLRPDAHAERALVAEWHRCRFLWNDAVEQMKTGQKISIGVLSRRLTALRAERDWLREGSQVVQQQELRTFARSFDHVFKVKGRRKPRFKSARRTLPSMEYTLRGFCVRERRLVLAKGVSIPVVWSRDLPSAPTSVRVYRDSLGHWYASFVVRREPEQAPEVEGSIGIDWGVATTATTTDPAYDLEHTGHRRRSAAELVKAQRRMARRRRPRGHAASKGYHRAKREAANVAKKARRRNIHAGRTWARQVVADHQVIAVEDFRPKFLSRSTMARKAADAAVATVKRTLIEYAERAGRRVVLVEPAYTTMTCSGCFARAKRLTLDERIFTCPACGLVEGRDRNAAKTILAVAERGHTSVEGVSHSLPPSQVVRVLPEVEIPAASTVGNR